MDSPLTIDPRMRAQGTMIVTWLERDLLPNGLVAEAALSLISGYPGRLFKLAIPWLTGRLESAVTDANINYPLLPWRADAIERLRALKQEGARLVLASKGPTHLAEDATRHLELFDEVVGGIADERTLAARHPNLADAGQPGIPAVPLAQTLRAAIKALRPHQWVKNVLVFVPLVVSGQIYDANGWMLAGLAFIAFSLAASSIYVLNDLSDLEADRMHARKRRRPLASGTLPIAWGMWLWPALLFAGLGIGALAGGIFFVGLYALMSMTYSLDLKKRPLFDVFALAALYTVRIYGGGEMTGHSPSVWLLAFSVFIFLGLALMKRMAELLATKTEKLKRRGYKQIDQPLLMAAGVACSFGASVVLALYLDSNEVAQVYAHPIRLWIILPLMLFWQLRLWYKTLHGHMTDDPIVYAAKDRISWIVGGLTAAAALAAGIAG